MELSNRVEAQEQATHMLAKEISTYRYNLDKMLKAMLQRDKDSTQASAAIEEEAKMMVKLVKQDMGAKVVKQLEEVISSCFTMPEDDRAMAKAEETIEAWYSGMYRKLKPFVLIHPDKIELN